ncbi:hypothetical protein [Bradyrhizobium sp. 1200_D9_N1_1]|uniref:hypothetical protein n=1 Tax=Bradyrhizobium sp. 1200_D9_N1_1 TaxID=3239013 RepID=UPI003F894A23
MTALSSYFTGTASVAADGTTVTGTSTLWLSAGNVKPGDFFQSGHFGVFITDVTDDTHLVVTPWPGSTLSGASYTIWKVARPSIVDMSVAKDVNKIVTAMDTSGFFVFVNINQTTPDPSLGDDGQYAFQPTTGKTWVKSAGVWSYISIYVSTSDYLFGAIYDAKAFGNVRRLIKAFADGISTASATLTNAVFDLVNRKITPSTSTGAASTALSASLNGNSSGSGGTTYRVVIAAAQLAAVSGSYIRVRLIPATSGNNTSISAAFIGKKGGSAPNFDGGQVPLSFSGNPGVTLTVGGSSVTSDWIPFAFSNASDLVLSFEVIGTSDTRTNNAATGITAYFKATSAEVGLTTVTGYSNAANFSLIFDLIEVAPATYGNMTVVTAAQTADASVSQVQAIIEYNPVAAVTLNTDLTAEVTCDGGAHWTAATLSLLGTGQGGNKVASTPSQATTAGTSIQARIKSANGKNVELHGVALKWL